MKFKLNEVCLEATHFLTYSDLPRRTKKLKITQNEYNDSILEYLKKIKFEKLESFSFERKKKNLKDLEIYSVIEEKDLIDFLSKNETIKKLKINFPALNLQMLKKIGKHFSLSNKPMTKFVYCNHLFTHKNLEKNIYKMHCPIEKRFLLLENYKQMRNLKSIDFDFGFKSPFQLKDDFLLSILKENQITSLQIPNSLITSKIFHLCEINLKNLKKIDISNCFELTNFDLAFIFQSFSCLKKVTLSNLLLSNECLEALSHLKDLVFLDLSCNKKIFSFFSNDYFNWFETKFMEKEWNLDYLDLRGFEFSNLFITQLCTAQFFEYLKVLKIKTNNSSSKDFMRKNRRPHQKFYINDLKYSNKMFSKKSLLSLTNTLINLKSIKILENALQNHNSISLKMYNILNSNDALGNILTLIRNFSEIELDFTYVDELKQELKFHDFHLKKVILIEMKYSILTIKDKFFSIICI